MNQRLKLQPCFPLAVSTASLVGFSFDIWQAVCSHASPRSDGLFQGKELVTHAANSSLNTQRREKEDIIQPLIKVMDIFNQGERMNLLAVSFLICTQLEGVGSLEGEITTRNKFIVAGSRLSNETQADMVEMFSS